MRMSVARPGVGSSASNVNVVFPTGNFGLTLRSISPPLPPATASVNGPVDGDRGASSLLVGFAVPRSTAPCAPSSRRTSASPRYSSPSSPWRLNRVPAGRPRSNSKSSPARGRRGPSPVADRGTSGRLQRVAARSPPSTAPGIVWRSARRQRQLLDPLPLLELTLSTVLELRVEDVDLRGSAPSSAFQETVELRVVRGVEGEEVRLRPGRRRIGRSPGPRAPPAASRPMRRGPGWRSREPARRERHRAERIAVTLRSHP